MASTRNGAVPELLPSPIPINELSPPPTSRLDLPASLECGRFGPDTQVLGSQISTVPCPCGLAEMLRLNRAPAADHFREFVPIRIMDRSGIGLTVHVVTTPLRRILRR